MKEVYIGFSATKLQKIFDSIQMNFLKILWLIVNFYSILHTMSSLPVPSIFQIAFSYIIRLCVRIFHHVGHIPEV